MIKVCCSKTNITVFNLTKHDIETSIYSLVGKNIFDDFIITLNYL